MRVPVLMAVMVLTAAVGAQAVPGVPPEGSSTPTPVVTWDDGNRDSGGTSFNGVESDHYTLSSTDLDAIKDLDEGTVVVSFSIGTPAAHAIVSGSDSRDASSAFCFCVYGSNGIYGAHAREAGSFTNDLISVRSGNDAGRVTAVLSVDKTNGSFLMTSQDHGESWATQRDSSQTGFFGSVSDMDSLVIGANKHSGGYEWPMDGTIYYVDIYSEVFTEAQAKAEIENTWLDVGGGAQFIRTAERTFNFAVVPPHVNSSEVSAKWTMPDGTTASVHTHTWMAPTTNDSFADNQPARVGLTTTYDTANEHYGYASTEYFWIAAEPMAQGYSQPQHYETFVFKNGEDGFGCYRIPAIIRAGNGDILAFAEGRPQLSGTTCSDFQNGTSVVMKRSRDNGFTWGPLQVVAQNVLPQVSGRPEATGRQWVAQNVTVALDKTDSAYPDGKLVIVYNANEKSIFSTSAGQGIRRVITAWSGDHGVTWNWPTISTPADTNDGDITNQVFHPHNKTYTAVYDAAYAQANYNSSPDWTFNQPTVGHSIQLQHGTSATDGRIYISGGYTPAGVGATGVKLENYAYWSDDGGASWKIGGTVASPNYYLHEAISVELQNGDVLLNSRAYNKPSQTIAGRVLTTATFDSSGEISFGTPTQAAELTTKAIGGGMARVTKDSEAVFGAESRIVFTAPNDGGSSPAHPTRNGMSLWMSTDEGSTWDAYGGTPKLLRNGPSVYSDILALPDTRIGVLYGGSYTSSFAGGGILFASATLDWLSAGTDHRAKVRVDTSAIDFDDSATAYRILTSSEVEDIKSMEEGTVLVSFKTTEEKTTEENSVRTIFSLSDAGDASTEWAIVETGSGDFGVHARNNGTHVNTTYVDQSLINDGQWHRMAVVVDASGTQIYLDGRLVKTSSDTGFFGDIVGADTGSVGLNVHSGGDEWPWIGSIGLSEVFDGVMTADQAITATDPMAFPMATWMLDSAPAPSSIDVTNPALIDALPQFEGGDVVESFAIGATGALDASPNGVAPAFWAKSRTAEGGDLWFGFMEESNEEGLRLLGLMTSENDLEWLAVNAAPYEGAEVSMVAVVTPEGAFLVINGDVVKSTATPIAEFDLGEADVIVGETAAFGWETFDAVAYWGGGVVPSERLASSLTAAGLSVARR